MRHPLALDLAGHTRAHMCKPCDARASTAAAIASSHAYLHAQLCRALRSPHSCSHFNSGRYCLNNALQDMAVPDGNIEQGVRRHCGKGIGLYQEWAVMFRRRLEWVWKLAVLSLEERRHSLNEKYKPGGGR